MPIPYKLKDHFFGGSKDSVTSLLLDFNVLGSKDSVTSLLLDFNV